MPISNNVIHFTRMLPFAKRRTRDTCNIWNRRHLKRPVLGVAQNRATQNLLRHTVVIARRERVVGGR